MAENRKPRRPAMLSIEEAENIQGDDDPAATALVANTSARALLGLADEEFGPDAVNRLVDAINREGVDIVADLWERSPAFTLPGAFWRIYLLTEWYRRDPLKVAERFDEGVRAPYTAGIDDQESIAAVPSLSEVMERASNLMSGRPFGDLTGLLRDCALVCRILASGATFGSTWIRSDRDRLATMVTRRARALVETANDLDTAADRAQVGRLV
ncbi:hypothetical protein [Gleimia hominis]|uniref:DNA-directed RNA polymerase subunit beta n=1 Tax=Gleimia hominis TaxID=595468 RepID=A0ABU3I7W0_9ACTO|nr:hypothetical protein [Gleimia hominis]MDT3766478.1 hypothetical protein [Gleimia hominis]WIK63863.1 hypothetical protein CJ187_005960 [Gleimia hominis]